MNPKKGCYHWSMNHAGLNVVGVVAAIPLLLIGLTLEVTSTLFVRPAQWLLDRCFHWNNTP